MSPPRIRPEDLLTGRPNGLRDRLRGKVRQAAIRVLGMEFDTEERDPAARKRGDPGSFDPSVIPKLVDGDGDTPGPNHREDIGRTWVAAQLAGGVAPFFIDMRPVEEVTAGTLPGAHLLPGDLVKRRLHVLPDDRTVRVTVFDQTSELGSEALAAWLRDNGWPMARRLRGGYAEWIEHAESIELPVAAPGGTLRPGDPVRLGDGREGRVLASVAGEGGVMVDIFLADGSTVGPLAERGLLG